METPIKLESIHNLGALKLLGDPRRMEILQRLMLLPATLSQLGRALEIHPAQIRHHLKRLESAGLVEPAHTKIQGGFLEKYYRASAQAYQVNLLITPALHDKETVISMGSDDPALDLLAEKLSEAPEVPALLNVPVGSLEGLIALRQGLCHMAGCHLWDADAGDFNLSYLTKLFPDRNIRAFTLTERIQGLLVRDGNPKHILGAEDFARSDVTFINRRAGSGTRLWIDAWFRDHRISTDQVPGYERSATTHLEVARSVANGEADVGIAVAAVSELTGIEFIPLFQERFDLIIAVEDVEDSRLSRLIDHLQSHELRRNIQALAGYHTSMTGNELSFTPTTGG